MKNIFTDHPRSMNETYTEHFRCSFRFGSTMLLGGIACMLHAIFPFIFKKTGSNLLVRMMHDYVDRMPAPEDRIVHLSNFMEKRLCRDRK